MKMITGVSFFVCLLCLALVNAKLNRIVGGDEAPPGQFKYQISLQDNHKRKCGAAIIADQYVLTAAHCVIDKHGKFYSSTYYVVAGSTNVHTDQGVRITVEKIYVPSIYSAKEKRNDIAVLKLCTGLDLGSNPNLQAINLPSSIDWSYVGSAALISGYGYTHIAARINPITCLQEEFDGSTDGKLRFAVTNIISNEECATMYKKYKIDENQICGQIIQNGGEPKGICKGDSGGPLVSANVIIGIASISPTGCREDKYAAIYTNVSSFLGFITQAMNDATTPDMLIREVRSGVHNRVCDGIRKFMSLFKC